VALSVAVAVGGLIPGVAWEFMMATGSLTLVVGKVP
jgi:hypothetical protein